MRKQIIITVIGSIVGLTVAAMLINLLLQAPYAYETQEMRARLDQQRLETQLRQEAAKQARIEWYATVWQYVQICVMLALGVALLSLSLGGAVALIRRGSVVFQHIGGSILCQHYNQVKRSENALALEHLMAIEGVRASDAQKANEMAQEFTRQFTNRSVDFLRAIRGTASQAIDIMPEQEDQIALPAHMPTFQEAIQFFRPHQILMGFDDQQNPVYLPLQGFVSAAAGGQTGSGKTSKFRFLLGQPICAGVNISILDAHEGNPQSLVNSLGALAFFPNVTIYHPYDIREAVDEMLAEVQRIIDGGTPVNPPRIYVLDELKPLNHAYPKVELLMRKIANEGRKYQVYGVFASQTWEAKMFKESGSAARAACVLKLASRMPKDQARFLMQDSEAAKVIAQLELDEMYVGSVQYSGVLKVPFAAPEDMNLLALEYFASREKVVNAEVDNGARQPHVSACVPDNVSEDKTLDKTDADTSPGQAQTGAGQMDTWLDTYMQETGKNESEIADVLGVSVSLIKKILRGERKLTSDKKTILEQQRDPTSNVVWGHFGGDKT